MLPVPALLTPKILTQAQVLLHLRLPSVEALFACVAEHVAASDERVAARIRTRLWRRHAWRPVGLGGGFALPHAAVPGLTTPCAVYVRSALGVDLGAADGQAVTDSLCLLIPSPGLSAEYELLTRLTRALQTAAVRQMLREATSPVEIQGLLTGCHHVPDETLPSASVSVSVSAAAADGCSSASRR